MSQKLSNIRAALPLSAVTRRRIVGKSLLSAITAIGAMGFAFAIIAVFFPVRENTEYGLLGGIIHGFFVPGNIFLKSFFWKRLLFAPHHNVAYVIGYYFFVLIYVYVSFYVTLNALSHYCKRALARQQAKNDLTEDVPVVVTSFNRRTEDLPTSLDEKLDRLAHPDFRTDISNRKVKIFVSSTFQDLQKERDYLMTHTFPKMSSVARERKVMLVPVDLRWGITEEEAHTGKVVEYCLKEIDNSVPFFIGIVGDRYGWCPDEEELEKNKTLKEQYGWLCDDFRKGLSVTEIEIQYGVLRRQKRMEAAFYFLGYDEVSDEDLQDQRVYRLREKIAVDERFHVSYFHEVEELGGAVEKDLTAFLDKYFPKEALSGAKLYCHEQMMRALAMRECYIERDEYSQVLDEFVNDDDCKLLCVNGVSGSGRTTLLANWCAAKGKDVLLHIASYRNGRGSMLDDLKDCLDAQYQNEVTEVIAIARRGELDEELLESMHEVAVSAGVKIIISGHLCGTDMDNCPEGVRILDVTPLDNGKRSLYIDRYLEPFGKKLTDKQKVNLLDAPALSNMLALRTVLDELVLFGDFEQLDDRINYYADARDELEIMDRYLASVEQRYGRKETEKILSRIALSYKGMESYLLDDVVVNAIHGLEIVNDKIAIGNELLMRVIEQRYLADDKKNMKNRKYLRRWSTSTVDKVYQFLELGDIKTLRKRLDCDILYSMDELEKEAPELYRRCVAELDL